MRISQRDSERRILPNVCRGDPQSGARYREPKSIRDRADPKFAARCREAGVRFPDREDGRNSGACVARIREREARNPQVLNWCGCRRAQLPRTLNPLILAMSLEARIERSIIENARQRQKTLPS